MPTLDLSPDELLSTTRAVRKRLDFDRPVEDKVVRECLELALQAPNGSNAQPWHFVVVTDEEKKAKLGEIYRRAFTLYRDMDVSAHKLAEKQTNALDAAQMQRVVSSAEYLAENLERAPVLVIPCFEGRTDALQGPFSVIANASQYGSVLPALWSFMLAARARGLGTSWTTLHLMVEDEAAGILGIPYAEVTQTALTPLAYTKGTEFKSARRGKPLDQIVHTNAW